MAAIAFLGLALTATWLAEMAGDKKTGEISALKIRLAEKDLELRTEATKLHLVRQTAALCNQLVERKVVMLKSNHGLKVDGMPWNPRAQALTIIQLIHGFVQNWLTEFAPGASLRLGVYLPDQMPNPREMELCFSWNGVQEDCYHKHPGKMVLVRPMGQYSIVVRTFHADGERVLNLIPDTKKAASFEFWSDEQKEHLHSIATFKCKIALDGATSALVLEMDCNAPGFFDESRRDPLTTLLVEMVRRFEYEMLCASLNAPATKDRKEVKN